MSKVLEKLFLKRLRTHILASPNFNPNQSAYRSAHFPKTALLLLWDRIIMYVQQMAADQLCLVLTTRP